MLLKSLKEIVRTVKGKRILHSEKLIDMTHWLHNLEFLVIKVDDVCHRYSSPLCVYDENRVLSLKFDCSCIGRFVSFPIRKNCLPPKKLFPGQNHGGTRWGGGSDQFKTRRKIASI